MIQAGNLQSKLLSSDADNVEGNKKPAIQEKLPVDGISFSAYWLTLLRYPLRRSLLVAAAPLSLSTAAFASS